MTLQADRLSHELDQLPAQRTNEQSRELESDDLASALFMLTATVRREAHDRLATDASYGRQAVVFGDLEYSDDGHSGLVANPTTIIWGPRAQVISTNLGEERVNYNFGLGPDTDPDNVGKDKYQVIKINYDEAGHGTFEPVVDAELQTELFNRLVTSLEQCLDGASAQNPKLFKERALATLQ